MKRQSATKEVIEDENSSDEEESKELKNKKSKHDEEDHLSENAYEDKKAAILLNKEEAEHALFKRIFQTKIKAMTCQK
jgi:hypothetical protein